MRAIHVALPKAAVTNAYGTTEAGPVVFGPHPKGLPQPEMSVGTPHPEVALRLVDGEDRNSIEGVLEMKCPALMNGYHNRPDVAPPFTADGFYVTGDVLRRDGATYAAEAAPDFLSANDAWFMPVSQKVGPDGCLYILDWYDRYHCYQDANRDPPGIDRLKGRLYRVRYKDTP